MAQNKSPPVLSSTTELHVPHQHQKVTVSGGIQLHCTVSGKGAHTLLCIPGALAPSQWAFARQLEHFGREDSGYTVVALDPRGYGNSTPHDREFCITPEHHLKLDAVQAYELMVLLGFPKFSILGWCSGGVSAIHLAADLPDAVKSLVIWGTRSYLTERDVCIQEELRDVSNWSPHFKAAFEAAYGKDHFWTLWNLFVDSVGATFEQLKGEMCSTKRGNVRCPSLILHGEKDRFTSLSHAEHIHEGIAGSELCTLPEGRHALQIHPDFNATVEAFLRSNNK